MSPLIKIPAGYLYTMTSKRTSWGYKTTTQRGLSGRAIDYPRGKVLGGCSSINGMIFMTGNQADYDTWANKYNNKGWNSKDLYPLFNKFVKFGLDQSDEGKVWGKTLDPNLVNSNYTVQNQRLKWDLLDNVVEACEEENIKFITNFNNSEEESCGYFQVNQNKGFRINSKLAFIDVIKERLNRNLFVLKDTQVLKVNFDKELNATSVSVSKKNIEISEIKAKKEIILCSGAINTPQLLQLSGIGCKKHLTSLNIKTLSNLPEVGCNLQDHLQIRTIFKLKQGTKTLNSLYYSIFGKISMGLNYIFKQSGPLSMAPSQLGIFTKSDKEKTQNNLQFHVQPLSLDKFGSPLHKFPGITMSVCNLKPTSHGTVKIITKDPFKEPKIDPNYLSTYEDKQVAFNSVLIARKLMKTKAMKQYKPNEYVPGNEVKSHEEIVKAIGEISSSIFHPVGTCRMTDNEGGVVDSSLSVKGVKRLRVVDASVMPEITSGNTNTPTLLIAEKAASIILKSNSTID